MNGENKLRKILLTSIALTTLAATSAMTAPAHHHVQRAAEHFNAVTRDSVISEGNVIGQDPDGYVRLELLRTAASPNQG